MVVRGNILLLPNRYCTGNNSDTPMIHTSTLNFGELSVIRFHIDAATWDKRFTAACSENSHQDHHVTTNHRQ
ncbi:hypothetical protein STEG23_034081, partial [Scotinomys teguina]